MNRLLGPMLPNASFMILNPSKILMFIY